jgi:hypothetical protein
VLDRLAQDLLRKPLRIHICRIEKIDSCLQADVDEMGCLRNIGLAPCPEKFTSTTERAGAKAQNRNLQAALPKLSKFHIALITEGAVWSQQ